MTERIDHVAEAREWLANADDEYTRQPPIRDNSREWIARAQVHATLALVEQQRIANLIALHRHEVKHDIGSWSRIYEDDDVQEPQLKAEIRDALEL